MQYCRHCQADPAIHSVAVEPSIGVTEWMPWSSHGMTTVLSFSPLVALHSLRSKKSMLETFAGFMRAFSKRNRGVRRRGQP